jgi:spore germination protein KA
MTMLRFVRFTAFFVSVLAPAFYVAITTFHQELIPTDLLFTMVAAREGTPFPAVFEATIMIIAFEILREAGVRLPRPVGQAISIVGALVMGDAAVSAGLIGAPMVIVIAITAVSIFAVPSQSESGAILRIIMLILAGTMGEFGITIGLLILLVHLSSLKSFGFSYLSPISPFQPKDNKDTFIRMPLWMMHKRPTGMAKNDQTRQDNFRPTSITNKNPNMNQEGEHSEKSN